VRLPQDRQFFWGDEEFDAARFAGAPPDEAALGEDDDHAVRGGGRDAKVGLEVRFGGRPPMQFRVGVDEGQVLRLSVREACGHGCVSDRGVIR
jgi:hypothetical protein